MSAEHGHGIALLDSDGHRVEHIRGRVLLRPERQVLRCSAADQVEQGEGVGAEIESAQPLTAAVPLLTMPHTPAFTSQPPPTRAPASVWSSTWNAPDEIISISLCCRPLLLT